MNTYSNIEEVQQIANKYGVGKVLKSSRKDKKYMIKNLDGKIVHFEAYGYAGYITHKDKKTQQI